MRKNLFFVLTLFILSVASANAQVTIGNDSEPRKGAVLDLSQQNGTPGGLLLPKVTLTTLTEFGLQALNDTEQTNVTGLVVYNQTAAEGISKGVYVWIGNKWMLIASAE
jgi:hypothetical protein